jgi:hypothetical protein
MFQTEIRNEPSLLAYMAQQFAVPICSLFFAFLGGNVIGCYVVVSVLAACLAFFVGSTFPQSSESGKWVWVILTLFLATVLISDSVERSVPHALRMLFYPPDEPESGWVFVMLTLPTLGTISYSVCMRFIARRARQTPLLEPLQ